MSGSSDFFHFLQCCYIFYSHGRRQLSICLFGAGFKKAGFCRGLVFFFDLRLQRSFQRRFGYAFFDRRLDFVCRLGVLLVSFLTGVISP